MSSSLDSAMENFKGSLPGFKYAFTEDYLQQDPVTATIWDGEVITKAYIGQGSTYAEAIQAATAQALTTI